MIDVDIEHLAQRCWTALVVDDDADATWVEVALEDFEFLGRKFNTIRAYSADEALRICAQIDDLKLLITDLVMETRDAGARLASRLAETCMAKHGADHPKFAAVVMTGTPELVPDAVHNSPVVMSVYDKNQQHATKFRSHLAAALVHHQKLLNNASD